MTYQQAVEWMEKGNSLENIALSPLRRQIGIVHRNYGDIIVQYTPDHHICSWEETVIRAEEKLGEWEKKP